MTSVGTTTAMQSPFTNKMLDDFRKQGDPLADEVIAVFATQYGNSIKELADKLQNMIRMPADNEMLSIIKQHFPDNACASDALEKFFSQANVAPEWADPEKLTLGGYVFQDHMFSGFMMLACSSLPVCYSCLPDVKVLSFTRRLIDNAPKRIAETAQMVTDVMGNGGLSMTGNKLSGKGFQSILKIRLIHASLRYLLLNKERLLDEHSNENNIDTDNFLVAYISESVQEQCNWYGSIKPAPWNVNNDDTPINNEALALTLLTFSYIILRGLNGIGVKLNKEQQNAYLHSWNVVGYALGVDEKFLAEFNSYEKAEVIFNQIMQRRRGPSEDGALLQHALLNTFSTIAWKVIPFPFKRILHVRRLARLITSILVSKETYAALGLKLSLYDYIVRFFIWMGIRLFGFFVNHKFLRPIANYMFGRIAQSLWDWRKDYADKKSPSAAAQHHIKTGISNPLIIPSKSVATSYLSGQ